MRKLYRKIVEQPIWYFLYTKRIFIYSGVFAAIFGVYIGVLLFGENSLQSLLNNRNLYHELLKEVNELQAQNARLQKDLFELRGLEP